MTRRPPAPPRLVVLTCRQRDVLHELCYDGATNRIIGRRLRLTENTVKHHMKAIILAFGVHDRTAVVVDVLRDRVRVRVVNRRDETVKELAA